MELFLQAPGQSGYYHFAITADGALYDALAMDAKAFDSAEWKVDSVQRDGFWQLTLTLPWGALGIFIWALGQVALSYRENVIILPCLKLKNETRRRPISTRPTPPRCCV
jgi:hypothetical protein